METGPVGLDRIEMFAAGLDHPEGITVTPDGVIYVGGEAGQIYRVEPDDTITEVANTGGFILGIAADAAGRIYAIDTVHRCVWRVEPDTGSHEVYASGPTGRPFGVPNWGAFDATGNMYLTDSGGWGAANGLIWRIRPGGEPEVWTESAVDFPNGCAVPPDGDCLLYVESLPGRICRIDIAADGSAGERTVLCELGLAVPDGVAITDDGRGSLCRTSVPVRFSGASDDNSVSFVAVRTRRRLGPSPPPQTLDELARSS